MKYAAESISGQYAECIEALARVKEDSAFQIAYSRFNSKVSTRELVDVIHDHHLAVQKKKPPYGKLPWFECIQKNTFIVRSAYSRKKSKVINDLNAYVYFYRSGSLLSFLKDLRKLNGQRN
ncbi:hypothetical protein BH11BAC1_BH11BAC1_27130 [soil metagenome]